MERGMKKWRPFKSLVEYDDYYNQMLKDREKIPKPILSDDQKEEINSVLVTLRVGDSVSYSYYNDGFIHSSKGEFFYCKQDTCEIVIDGLPIHFDNLISLSHN